MRDGPKCTGAASRLRNRPGCQTGMVTLTRELIDVARAAGAVSVGATTADELIEGRRRLEMARSQGMAGPLGFTYDDPATATQVRLSYPWARSLLVFGVSYVHDSATPPPSGPIVARFATKDFYQPVRNVASAVTAHLMSGGQRAAILIDDNRLADRAAAIRSGVGWFGRSTMVLAPGAGPWMLLGTVVTDAQLEPTGPMRRDCGTCTACIPACPTGAITDGALDARRCLSTWLQTPGSIPHWVRPILGRRIYGCDDCLTSCPPGHPALRASPKPGTGDTSFTALLAQSDDALLERFDWWFVPRRDGRYIRRNLIVAAGNSGEADVVPQLVGHLASQSSMIRGHAAWSLARSQGVDAVPALRGALAEERAPEAREEMLLALLMVERPGTYGSLLADDEKVTSEGLGGALALVGADIDVDTLPDHGLASLMVTGPSPTPDVEDALVATLIRVNDRARTLERLRQRARLRLDGGRHVG